MSHWAKIGNDNIVTTILVGNDNHEDEGYQWLIDNHGGTWIKTSYNTYGGVHSLGGIALRKNYACIGYTYDSVRDAFIMPKPYDSWTLNEETCLWDAPNEMPVEEGKNFSWNEETLSWDEINGN